MIWVPQIGHRDTLPAAVACLSGCLCTHLQCLSASFASTHHRCHCRGLSEEQLPDTPYSFSPTEPRMFVCVFLQSVRAGLTSARRQCRGVEVAYVSDAPRSAAKAGAAAAEGRPSPPQAAPAGAPARAVGSSAEAATQTRCEWWPCVCARCLFRVCCS